jgi:hypothetical protein
MDIGTISGELFRLYSQFQSTHPLIGSMIAAEVIFVAGDAASQLISDKKIDTRKIQYTATLAPLYGVCINGLLESGDLVGTCVADSPALKSALGPNLWGNFFNIFFFVNNTVGEKEDYKLTRLLQHYRKILITDSPVVRNFKKRCKDNFINLIPKREYLCSVVATLTVWNVFQYINYSYVQDEMRTSAALAASVVWTSVLSLWSLRGRRAILCQL